MSNGSKSGKSSTGKQSTSTPPSNVIPEDITNIQETGFHFLAGLTSGVLSAVLLQPADLLKTRMQQSNSPSLLTTIRSISSQGHGLLSFWRGTLPSALRTGFGSAIYFTSLNTLRQSVAKSNILAPLTNNGHSSSLPKLSAWANLGTGAVARAGAGFILMPMTIIKVRYESNLYAYRSIAGASRDILVTEGLRGFFSGFGATAIRDAPYAGLYVLFYESLKSHLSLLTHTIPLPGQSMTFGTSASINFTSGILAAGLATAITNPFDAIKTRIQIEPRVYRNVVQGMGLMVRRDGIRSLADGLGLRMGRKAVSSALAWTVYEESVRRAEVAWGKREGTL